MRFGAIAQLVEHLHGMQGVRGSNPLGSMKFVSSEIRLEGFRKSIDLNDLV